MRRLIVIFLVALALGAQRGGPPPEKEEPTLPSGKSQRREILKSEFEKSKADAAELVELTRQLKEEIDKSDYQVLDLRVVKKAEDIEKLARRIKDRLRRY